MKKILSELIFTDVTATVLCLSGLMCVLSSRCDFTRCSIYINRSVFYDGSCLVMSLIHYRLYSERQTKLCQKSSVRFTINIAKVCFFETISVSSIAIDHQ